MKPGDRVRWRARNFDTPPGYVLRGPWIHGRVRYVFQDGTVRIACDDGVSVDRHPKFRHLESVSAIDQLAALTAEDKTDGR